MNSEAKIAAWRVAVVWSGLSMLGTLLAMPFLFTLIDGLNVPNRPPLLVLALLSVIQTGVMAFVLSWAGTAAGRKLAIGSPWVESWLTKKNVSLEKSFGTAILLGIIGGILVIVGDAVFAPHMPPMLRPSLPQPTPFQGLLASAYGGIAEEVLMRLGATTLFAWLVAHVFGFEGRGRSLSLALGIIFGALVFGAGHLPLAFSIWPASSIVVARILVLNAIVGLVAGYMYIRRGLEHAILLHFTADIVIYVIRPLLQSLTQS